MMKKYTLHVTLTILGPFLTSAASVDSYGFNKAFRRNQYDEPIIPASHIKGKLRTAFQELATVEGVTLPQLDINHWFGRKSDQDEAAPSRSYEAHPSVLHISNFQIEGSSGLQPQPHTRTKIHKGTRTASENSLRTFESLFQSGAEIKATGDISYYAAEADADVMAATLKMGFQWITALGAEKGVGFGRLKEVVLSSPQTASTEAEFSETTNNWMKLQLRIRPLEPILIGGIKKRRTNYVRSESIMSGGLIKGALAGGLNRVFGRDVSKALTEAPSDTFPHFNELAANFSQIRISHGYPVYPGHARPYRKPISLVEMEGHEVDLALASDAFPISSSGKAPVYFIDWKEYVPYDGIVAPRELYVTRTAIDEVSRRSQEGQLFTYAFLCPEDENGNAIEWVADVDFAAVPEAVRQQTVDQFIRASLLYLDRLGKLGRSVEVEVKIFPPPPAHLLIRDGVVLVTLQAPTLMLDPELVRLQDAGKTLRDLYANYWGAVSNNTLVLEDFFAHQYFEGGYLYHRYLGQHERTDSPNNYYPYYLTDAGSVFRLKPAANQEQTVKALLAGWEGQGLPLPAWALARYGNIDGVELWQTCPFVPENGYGEIAVNLDCHWDKKL